MTEQIQNLLNGKEENHVMPFLWLHGEDEKTLREMMAAVSGANCRAVCIESRPHPDFLGEKWWKDMDIILDEAKKKDMKIWILDDSHFPTGYAGGAVKNAPLSLHRQSMVDIKIPLEGESGEVVLTKEDYFPIQDKKSPMEELMISLDMLDMSTTFDDDSLLSIVAVNQENGEVISLSDQLDSQVIRFQKPKGRFLIHMVGLSRNCGPHRDYINMMNESSCRILIDTVYEAHYAHYKDEFGKTIAGFFSDEPELGNGHIYDPYVKIGTDNDLCFAAELIPYLQKDFGENWQEKMYLLWDNSCGIDKEKRARARYAYMNAVTRQVQKAFSKQIGDWCREHGVRYIGHMVEDCNADGRTGPSLGHYFRGLSGQDMAGIDDIGGQVYPQGEGCINDDVEGRRDGSFYHYQMPNLAVSAAQIESGKAGNSMCEIFGNYGWAEGLRLEKYLADHFMVCGINNFVPHAFSGKKFPDPDCPPHFYAHGHNPQYRHFGKLITYINRVSTLISEGRRVPDAAVLYHAESEWSGQAMLSEKPVRILMENQLTADILPQDIFSETEKYHTDIVDGLRVNGQIYRVLFIPSAEYISKALAEAVPALIQAGVRVCFIESLPVGIYDIEEAFPDFNGIEVVALNELPEICRSVSQEAIHISAASTYVRALHYRGESELVYLVNEAEKNYEGSVTIPFKNGYVYDAFENRIYSLEGMITGRDENSMTVKVCLLPLHSLIIIKGIADSDALSDYTVVSGQEWEITKFERSVCEGKEYPRFTDERTVCLPDHLDEEKPDFSGFVRYETSIHIQDIGKKVLTITDASEGVEVFVDGVSAGIQIVPPFIYDLTELLTEGEHQLRIEVATTLERECYGLLKELPFYKATGLQEPSSSSGLTGKVILYSGN